jgi:hypothetical protein
MRVVGRHRRCGKEMGVIWILFEDEGIRVSSWNGGTKGQHTRNEVQ